MARKKTAPQKERLKNVLSDRLKDIRMELFGEHGGPDLARRLGIPARTWYNYEMGVTVPAEVVLHFIDVTKVDPAWLISGRGDKYRVTTSESSVDRVSLRLPDDLLHRVSGCLEEGHLVIDVTWKRSK